MKSIGIFEAKTRFPALCAEIAQSGLPVLVRRRGHPLVVIHPVSPDVAQSREDIHTAWKRWQSDHKDDEESDFPEVWKERVDRVLDPFEQP